MQTASSFAARTVRTTTLAGLSASQDETDEQTVKMTPSGQMPRPGGLSQSLNGISMVLFPNSKYTSELPQGGPRLSTSGR